MTDDQHRRIGAILGFPECCVEAWIEGKRAGIALAAERGCIVERTRTRAEAICLDAEVSALLGHNWHGCRLDRRKAWVPCPDCAMSPAANLDSVRPSL